jgi:hypothetical protein
VAAPAAAPPGATAPNLAELYQKVPNCGLPRAEPDANLCADDIVAPSRGVIRTANKLPFLGRDHLDLP